MQIGSFNPLNILPGTSSAAGKSDDAEKARQAAQAAEQARAKAVSVAAEIPPQQDAAGVVRIAADGTTLPADLVYGNGSATTDGSDVDTNEMAQRYSQAMERAAGNSTNLSVDSNGVLLARPVSSAEVKAQAFVHNAVTAMRDHADAQERLKAASTAGDNASAMQKLAARFKLFS